MQDMLAKMQAEMSRQRTASGASTGSAASHPSAAASSPGFNNNLKPETVNGSVNGVGTKGAPIVKINQVWACSQAEYKNCYM